MTGWDELDPWMGFRVKGCPFFNAICPRVGNKLKVLSCRNSESDGKRDGCILSNASDNIRERTVYVSAH